MDEIKKLKDQLETDRSGKKTAKANLREAKNAYSRAVKENDEAAIEATATAVKKAESTLKRFAGKVRASKERLRKIRVEQQPRFIRKAIDSGMFRSIVRYSTYGITVLTMTAIGIVTYKMVSTSDIPSATDEV